MVTMVPLWTVSHNPGHLAQVLHATSSSHNHQVFSTDVHIPAPLPCLGQSP